MMNERRYSTYDHHLACASRFLSIVLFNSFTSEISFCCEWAVLLKTEVEDCETIETFQTSSKETAYLYMVQRSGISLCRNLLGLLYM